MALKYVKDFEFPSSFGFHQAKPLRMAKGGHVSTPQCYKGGGATRTEKTSGIQPPAFAKGGHWIKGAIKNPGALYRKLGVPQGQKIPAKKLDAAAKKGGVEGKEANLAKTLKGFRHKAGGHISTPQRYAVGGKVAVKDSGANNPNDAVSPGSFKRKPPGAKASNMSAAKSTFSKPGNTKPATNQNTAERMAGWSDFKNGGRIKNLGHYAHGGKVKPGAKYEKAAGTPKKSAPAKQEVKSGKAMSMGGLSRGTSHKKNAAIHAKNHPKGGALSAIAGAMAPQGPGIGAPPPGMAPPMGGPPGMPMGPRAAPPMAGGAGGPPQMPGGMAGGGAVKHVFVHHVSHGRAK